MNKKGQTMGIGMIVMIAIAIIVGAIFLQAIAQSVGVAVSTVVVSNDSNVAGANGETFYITDYRAISGVSILNGSNVGESIGSGNYTVTNNVVYNGALAISITVDDTEFESQTWYVSGTAEPLTYIPDSGGRAMANLIVVMFALAILAAVLAPVIKDGMNFS